MTYEPLYHKYRPQSFAELVGQDAISQTLSNALRQQRIAHAYLFTGPRGTGKTSSARILAKSLNCIRDDVPTPHPCGVCEICRAITQGSALDVIEIDAASNTGVDNIRELIERSQFAPAQCRYKVYVVDECHMLSTAAFNALLKTLEEPPPRVVFVLATTDPQRVLPTIISRCQRFDFRRIPLEAMVSHLQVIADQEGIDIASDAVLLVAQLAQGGLRDAESLLDQLSLLPNQISVEAVWDLVGAVPEQSLLQLVQVIHYGQPEQVLDCARQLMDRGREPLIVLQNLASFYRDMLIAKTAPDRTDLVAITAQTWTQLCEFVQSLPLELLLRGQQHLRSAEVQVKNTTQPRLWLEITLLGLLPASLSPMATATAPPVPLPLSPPVSLPTLTTSVVSPVPPTSAASSAAIAPLPTPEPVSATASVSTETAPPSFVAASTLASDPDHSHPEQTPPQEAPVPIADPPASATMPEFDLEQMWEQIIPHIQPTLTQVLARQQCRLLSLRTSQARLGVKTHQLLKIAQSKLTNFEAAFQSVLQRPIKVTLEVMATEVAGSSAAASPTVPVAPPPTLGVNPAIASTVPTPVVASPVLAADPPPPSPPVSAPPPMRVDPPTPAAIAPPSPAPELSPPPEVVAWQPPDALDRAVQSLADFFRGQIVKGEGEGDHDLGLGGDLAEWDVDLAESEDTEA